MKRGIIAALILITLIFSTVIVAAEDTNYETQISTVGQRGILTGINNLHFCLACVDNPEGIKPYLELIQNGSC